MGYDNRRGGKPAQQQHRGGGRPRQETSRLTVEEKEALLGGVLAEIYDRRDEIASVLPPDVSFEAFHASINQALRRNPKLMDCTGPSLVNASVQSAYDGLKVDGREAAIVDANEKIPGTDRYRKVARYMPLAFGLRKQIVQSGLVSDVQVTLVYENEPFEIIGGDETRILHKVIMDDDRRGPLRAVYSIAKLKDGTLSRDWMTRAQVLKVRAKAATDYVWSEHEEEMWRKTMLRRHRKTLPSTRDVVIRDMEARTMFPQFRDSGTPALSAPDRPRPQREDYRQLDAPRQSFDYDFGGQDEPQGEVVDHAPQEAARREQARAVEPDGAQEGRREAAKADEVTLPSDWQAYFTDIMGKIAAQASEPALTALRRAEAAIFSQAPDEMRSQIDGAFTDRMADIVADEAADAGSAAKSS